MTAVVAPVLLGVTGGAVDLFVYQNQKALMKTAADFAALAAAKEASLKGWSAQIAREVADSIVKANIEGKAFSDGTQFQTEVLVNEADKSVEVILKMNEHSFFVLGYFKNNPQISVASTARAMGETSLCVIGLDNSAASTVKLTKNGRLTAPDCAVHSNSAATDGISSVEDAVLSAATSCTAGGFSGAPKNFSKAPTTDCPVIADPLSKRATPKVGNCDFTNMVVKAATVTLKPGTYCGGIDLQSRAIVTFDPGIYVIKDGVFDADSNSSAVGEGISFYFTGKGSRLTFDNTTELDFKAPQTGAMAGILFFQDPAAADGEVFEISSKRALNLLGTIYLPKATLRVNANNSIAEASDYTVIVSRKLEIGKYSELVINSDYASSAVPVPAGLGSSGKAISLVK